MQTPPTINFSCNNCDRRFAVDASKAGTTGKCAACHHKVQVPDAELEEFLPDDTKRKIEDPHTRVVYDTLRSHLESSIASEDICDGDGLLLTLRLGCGRRQSVLVSVTDSDRDDARSFSVLSGIGRLPDLADAETCLQFLQGRPALQIYMDSVGSAWVTSQHPITDKIRPATFARMVEDVAQVADTLEAVLLQLDAH